METRESDMRKRESEDTKINYFLQFPNYMLVKQP